MVGGLVASPAGDVIRSVSLFIRLKLKVTQLLSTRPSILTRLGGATIAYHYLPGIEPGVVFCTGFKSDMTGGKALALEQWCAECGRQFTRFDYQGHGASSGAFEDGTIGQWRADALAVLDEVTKGPQVIVGSSMGGWIAFLLAVDRPERVAGILGIAPAVDFTQALLWPRMPEAARREITENGVWYRPSVYEDGPYPITKTLIDEGRNNLLLPGPIPFDGPVRLIHGMLDDAVPWEHSLTIANGVRSDDVEITMVKDGEHRLSRDRDIERMIDLLQDILGPAVQNA